MRTIHEGLLLLVFLPALAAGQIPGEVSCDKGADMPKVQALVKKTVEALKKDQATVIREINRGDSKWKDGYYYMVVVQGTQILAHGYFSSAAGMDAAKPPYDRMFPAVKLMEQIALTKGEGCVQYNFMNPAKNGQVEHKVTYVTKVSGNLWAASGTYLLRK
jgi:single cache domain-containing protein